MKKVFIISIVLLIINLTASACPICGCGGGNLYMGLLPDFKSHFIGLRYHYAQYHSQLVSDPDQFSTNYYNSIEFWGGMRVGKKFQVMAFVPYYFNKQVDDDGTTTPSGLGDITLSWVNTRFFIMSVRPAARTLLTSNCGWEEE